MRHWLFMFRPETFEVVRREGVIGVLDTHRRRFAALVEGDRFITYLSRLRVLDGHGVLTSGPYVDDTQIFPVAQRYPWRCRVTVQRTGAAVPAADLLWTLGCWPDPMKTDPSNYLFCYGGFAEIPAEAYARLREVIS